MLTEKEKTQLDQIFGGEALAELTLQQADRISSQTKIPLRAVEWFALKKGLPPRRYSRNIGSIGIDGQMKLLESKVIIVGLGGLGGYLSEELARAGLGQIISLDHDVFDETNLNRQLLANEGNLGKKKVDQLRDRLKKVNRAVEFTGFAVTVDNLPDEIWRDVDLVFDCLDNIDDRFILAEKCSEANVLLVHGAIAGWFGQVCVVWPGTAMMEKIYKSHKRGVEKDMGTPPFTAAVTASLMAAEGIKILTGKKTQKEQKVVFFDLLEDEWEIISFDENTDVSIV
jgi:molybdopterin/thiamine biosynthesis adenylyltransferase